MYGCPLGHSYIFVFNPVVTSPRLITSNTICMLMTPSPTPLPSLCSHISFSRSKAHVTILPYNATGTLNPPYPIIFSFCSISYLLTCSFMLFLFSMLFTICLHILECKLHGNWAFVLFVNVFHEPRAGPGPVKYWYKKENRDCQGGGRTSRQGIEGSSLSDDPGAPYLLLGYLGGVSMLMHFGEVVRCQSFEVSFCEKTKVESS